MFTSSKTTTFKKKLFELSAWIFAIIAVVALISVYALYQFQSIDSRNRAHDFLSRNIDRQVDRLIPTFLLEEQWSGTELMLAEIRRVEKLSDIQIVNSSQDLPLGFKHCAPVLQQAYCLLESQEQVGLVVPLREGSLDFGYLVKLKSRKDVLSAGRFLQFTYAIFILLGVAIMMLTWAVLRYINKEAKYFLKGLTKWLSLVMTGEKKNNEQPRFRIDEMNELTSQIGELILEHEQSSRRAIVSDVVRQVAHDIRSPLAALEMSVQDLKALPEEKRLLIKSACDEIHDIVNVLRESSVEQSSNKINSLSDNTLKLELLCPILQTLISEKRTQYKNKGGLVVAVKIDSTALSAFVNVSKTDFKRVLSNVINNSVEAFEETENAQVTLSLKDLDSFVSIKVTDNGKGIPEDVVGNVFNQGVSFAKKQGTGLGLFHAKQCVDEWGGQISVDSRLGHGTTVTIVLPRAPAPQWYGREVILNQETRILVLDDDPSIHLLWKNRLRPLLEKSKINSVFHFHSGEALVQWWKALPKELSSTLVLLMDYELLGEDESGLDIVKQIGLYAQTIFVTSHYDEGQLQQECEKLGAKLIPKNMAAYISLSLLDEHSSKNYILIDDSKLTRLSWSIRARERGIKFKNYSAIDEFKSQLRSVEKNSIIYIDSDFGEGMQKGEDFAKDLFLQGYTNLYLATGHTTKSFETLKHIKGVVGKDPPWG